MSISLQAKTGNSAPAPRNNDGSQLFAQAMVGTPLLPPRTADLSPPRSTADIQASTARDRAAKQENGENVKPSGSGLLGPAALAATTFGTFALADGPLPIGDAIGLVVGAGILAKAAIDNNVFGLISRENLEDSAKGVRPDLFPNGGLIESGPLTLPRDPGLGDPNAAMNGPDAPDINLEQPKGGGKPTGLDMPVTISRPDNRRYVDLPSPRQQPALPPAGGTSSPNTGRPVSPRETTVVGDLPPIVPGDVRVGLQPPSGELRTEEFQNRDGSTRVMNMGNFRQMPREVQDQLVENLPQWNARTYGSKTPEQIREVLNRPDLKLFVVSDEAGKIGGMAGLRDTTAVMPDNSIEEAKYLTLVAGAPELKGAGTQAFQRALQDAGEGGYNVVAYTTGTENFGGIYKNVDWVKVPDAAREGGPFVLINEKTGEPFINKKTGEPVTVEIRPGTKSPFGYDAKPGESPSYFHNPDGSTMPGGGVRLTQ